MGLWRGLGYAAACVLLIIGAFFADRIWEQRRPRVEAVKPIAPAAKQQVVLVVLSDHLDRSERLLVELKHADAKWFLPCAMRRGVFWPRIVSAGKTQAGSRIRRWQRPWSTSIACWPSLPTSQAA